MIEPLGYEFRFSNSIMAVFSAYLINYTIPRAGEVSRATILSNYENIPFEKVFGTIVAERVADVLVMILIIAFTLIWQFEIICDFLFKDFNLKSDWLPIIPILSFLIYGGYLALKKSNHPLVKRSKSIMKGFFEGVTSIFKMKYKWSFISHTLLIWAMYVLMFYVTSLSIDSISQLPFSAILIGFIAASFSVAATNGGVGAYPLAVYAAFSIFNIEEVPSLAFGWIMWSSHTVMIVVMGGLSLVFLPIYNRLYQKKNKT